MRRICDFAEAGGVEEEKGGYTESISSSHDGFEEENSSNMGGGGEAPHDSPPRVIGDGNNDKYDSDLNANDED